MTFARRLAPALLTFIALAAPAAASAAQPCANAGLVPDASNVAETKAATLCLLNVERAARRLPRLLPNRPLGEAAQSYSAAMVSQRFFDHISPLGTTLSVRVTSASYRCGSSPSWILGENLAWGTGSFATPQEIVQQWMQSSGHRHNILERHFRHVGIGIAIGAPQDVGGMPAATYTTDFGSRVVRRVPKPAAPVKAAAH
jgi:uncharacterized protein YkwD